MGTGKSQPKLLIRAAGLTDVGCVRPCNEDAFLASAEEGVFIVADGLGGHAHGEVAAGMVVELLPQIIHRRIVEARVPDGDNDATIRGLLLKSVWEVSDRVRLAGQQRLEHRNMGATVVVVLLTARHAHIAHMGDSRAYLLHERELSQLTLDHSIVSLLVQQGELTPREAERHPAKNALTRFVGMDIPAEPSVRTVDLQPGDRLLLCTDGLWGMVADDSMRSILAVRADPAVTCRDLIAAGKGAGGRDNLTAVVIDIVDHERREIG